MRSFLLLLAVFTGLVTWALVDSRSRAMEDAEVTGALGDPIPGLDALELFRFEQGRRIFEKRWTRGEGLGPHFNATSCNSCHEDPVPGGSSQRYRDFFLAAETKVDGTIAKLYPDCTTENVATHRSECCLPSMVVPHYGPKGTLTDPVAADVEHPSIPARADVVARRNAPPLFGIGLFRLVSDEEILSRADPDDSDGDGISGRVNIIDNEEGNIGRFGYKCQTGSIEAFNRGALHNQMGITSDSIEEVADAAARPGLWHRLFEVKSAWAQEATPVDRIRDFDGRLDPEITRSELINLVSFQENLAAPRRGTITTSVRDGEQLFDSIGCTGCHVESLNTPIGLIHPWTDLLIHDMGPELADGIQQHQATGSEFRTQPLWGLCHHRPFLHDGRADTVEEAILLHGGEAAASRQAYSELSDSDRQLVLRFLESL